MHPFDYPLLADENIHPQVIAFLRAKRKDIKSVFDEGLAGQEDTAILHMANAEHRVVITHDSDFGKLTLLKGEPFTGILYLRPGHVRAEFTMGVIDTLIAEPVDVNPPFIVVAAYKAGRLQIRVRQLSE